MIDPELVKALDEAIEIHENRVSGKPDGRRCPLCKYDDAASLDLPACQRCPIGAYVGSDGCWYTPYARCGTDSSPEEVAFLKWIRYLYLNGWLEVP